MAPGKKIKILYTIPNFDTAGSGKALLKVASRLNKEEFDPHIMCMHDGGYFFKEVVESGIPVHLEQYTTLMKPYTKGVLRSYRNSRLLKRIRPDIIHSYHYGADYSEPLAARFAGIKWVYTKKSMSWGGNSANAWKLRSRMATAIVIQNSDMRSEFFPGSKKTRLIPRGVDTTEFYPRKPNPKLLEQWEIQEEERLIICVANMVPVKGIEVLLRAFASLQSEFHEWKLLLLGDHDSEYGRAIQKLSSALNIQNKTVFLGKHSNVAEYLNLAEIFVLPTLNEGRKEGSPVSMLEAMACGLRVLGSEIPGIRDQLESCREALFPAGNQVELEQKLRLFMNQGKEEAALRSKTMIQLAKTTFSLENEVRRTEDLYKELVR